jgi:hypothetical protein
MSRWPAIVAVVTELPAGQRFEPLEVKVVVAPGRTSMLYRLAR